MKLRIFYNENVLYFSSASYKDDKSYHRHFYSWWAYSELNADQLVKSQLHQPLCYRPQWECCDGFPYRLISRPQPCISRPVREYNQLAVPHGLASSLYGHLGVVPELNWCKTESQSAALTTRLTTPYFIKSQLDSLSTSSRRFSVHAFKNFLNSFYVKKQINISNRMLTTIRSKLFFTYRAIRVSWRKLLSLLYPRFLILHSKSLS